VVVRAAPRSNSCYLLLLLLLLYRVKSCADAKDCNPADLLLPELAVVTPEAKLMQAEVYRRMIWDLKTQ
jgi:hypothetical protein